MIRPLSLNYLSFFFLFISIITFFTSNPRPYFINYLLCLYQPRYGNNISDHPEIHHTKGNGSSVVRNNYLEAKRYSMINQIHKYTFHVHTFRERIRSDFLSGIPQNIFLGCL